MQLNQRKKWSWWGSTKTESPETEDNIVKKFGDALTNEEKEKLYAAIGYQENAAQLILPEEYEAIQMTFKLLSLEILVADEIVEKNSPRKLQPIITLRLSTVTCAVNQRPAANAIKLNIGIKEFTITGFEKKKKYQQLLNPKFPMNLVY